MRCPICAWDSRKDKFMRLTKHHVVPRREGGGKYRGNIVKICVACHTAIDFPNSLQELREASNRKDWCDSQGKTGRSYWESMRYVAAHKRIPELLDRPEVMLYILYYRNIISMIEKRLIKKDHYLSLEYLHKEYHDET